MGQQAGDAPSCELRETLGIVRVMERVRSVLGAEREVHMQAAPAAIAEWPAEERREFPMSLAYLANEELEEERLVGGGDRVRVLDVHLVRRVVVLAAPSFDREPRSDRRVDELIDHAGGVDRHAGAVHAVRGHRYGGPSSRV